MMKRLMDDLKSSMKNKDVYKKEVVQMLIGKAKSLAKDTLVEVEDKHVLAAAQSELKQTREALDMMRKNLTPEKLAEYEYKIKTIESYLPTQLDTDQVIAEVVSSFNELGLTKDMKSMGALMKHLKEKLGGSVDNTMLSKVIKDFLSQK